MERKSCQKVYYSLLCLLLQLLKHLWSLIMGKWNPESTKYFEFCRLVMFLAFSLLHWITSGSQVGLQLPLLSLLRRNKAAAVLSNLLALQAQLGSRLSGLRVWKPKSPLEDGGKHSFFKMTFFLTRTYISGSICHFSWCTNFFCSKWLPFQLS